MAWTYDPANLGQDTPEGRKDEVRLLIGDTNPDDPQMQDEEIHFALSTNGDDTYAAAIWCATTLSSKFARLVNTEVDGTLKAEYGGLSKSYRDLSSVLNKMKKRQGKGLGAVFIGTKVAELDELANDKSRVQPDFTKGKFENNRGT